MKLFQVCKLNLLNTVQVQTKLCRSKERKQIRITKQNGASNFHLFFITGLLNHFD